MKLLNFFKKQTNTNIKSIVQKLDKNQLYKVIGGAEVPTNNTVAGGPLKGIDVKLG